MAGDNLLADVAPKGADKYKIVYKAFARSNRGCISQRAMYKGREGRINNHVKIPKQSSWEPQNLKRVFNVGCFPSVTGRQMIQGGKVIG